MKCEHGKAIKIVLAYRETYIDDGFESYIEGCAKCKLNLEARFPSPVDTYICNMARDGNCFDNNCISFIPHIKTDVCNRKCDRNHDAVCVGV